MKLDSKIILEKLKKGELYLKAYIEAREDIEKETDHIESLPECPPEIKKKVVRGPSRTETDQKNILKILMKNHYAMTTSEIAKQIKGISYQQTKRTLTKLEKLGKVELSKKGNRDYFLYISTIEKSDPFLTDKLVDYGENYKVQQMDVK